MRPCIRGLKRFEKKGCPEKAWNGTEGCPAWREMIIPTRANPLQKENRAQCLDEWYFDFQWAALGLLEGNQAATESFRNNMSTPDGQPKPDPAAVELIRLIHTNRRLEGSHGADA